MEWMAWTWPTAVFFVSIVSLLIAMSLGEIYRPSISRKGWLPIETTRGDRLFIGLISAAFFNLAWIAILDISQWWALLATLVLVLLIFRKA